MWIGAEVTMARGGRRAHGPVLIKRPKKINKTELILALHSALGATFNESLIAKRYSSLETSMKSVVVESKLDNLKSKDLLAMIQKIFSGYNFALKEKQIRAGKGKTRNRRYKSNQGILFVKANDEKIKAKGIDIISAKDLSIVDVYPLGRLTIYTEKALNELEAMNK